MTSDLIRLVVVDDQAAIRETLAVMLDLADDVDVVATAADGAQAVEAARRHRPDVMLMDLTMPVMDGVAATRVIREAAPDISVLVLTTFAEDQSILAALQAGASGFLTKASDRAAILHAVRMAARGQSVLTPAVRERLLVLADSGARTPCPTSG